jgi:hypothetical protein
VWSNDVPAGCSVQQGWNRVVHFNKVSKFTAASVVDESPPSMIGMGICAPYNTATNGYANSVSCEGGVSGEKFCKPVDSDASCQNKCIASTDCNFYSRGRSDKTGVTPLTFHEPACMLYSSCDNPSPQTTEPGLSYFDYRSFSWSNHR